jgi:hypothetical protein
MIVKLPNWLRHTLFITAALVLFCLCYLIGTLGQQAPAPPAPAPAPPATYTLTEVQAPRLMVAFQSTQLSRKDLQTAQNVFQARMQDLQAEGEKVKAENNWPTAQFDMNNLRFCDKMVPAGPGQQGMVCPAGPMPAAPPPRPAPPKPEPKK